MKYKSRSRSLFLLMGLVILTLVLPGAVSAQSPTAHFTADTIQGNAPLTVQFTSQSDLSGSNSYAWDINNDGKTEYTTKNAVHTYQKAGNYTVKLSVNNADGKESVIKTNYIKVSAPVIKTPPTAQFSANTVQGNAPLTVQFTDKSVSAGTTSYQWDINNDGKTEYTTKNAVHTYQTAGDYTVTLTVNNADGKESVIKTNYIKVSAPVIKTPPTAQFSANTVQGNAPLTVQFTDQSVSAGTTSYQWDINNDGKTEYTTKNAVHTYQTAGDYTVTLTVNNADGKESVIKTNYIKVSAPSTSSARSAPSAPSAPSITVTSPNGGVTWQRGTTHTVTWSYTGSPGSTVKIVLLKAGTEVGTIKDSWSIGSGGTGSYTWPIGPSGSTGSDYKVSVQSISQPAIKDTNTNYFTLTSGTSAPSAPSITVTSPNGGVTWQRGTTHTVTWSYTGSPGSTVKIVLLKAGTEVGTIKDSWSIGSGGTGSYTWPIYSTGTTGSDFKVSVQSISQPAIKDTSTNYFTLTSGTSAPVINTLPPVINTLPTDETIGAESNPTGNPIGGGAGYSNSILPGNPKIKYTVTNYAEFASALTKTYMKGDIIYVPETASIDMTGHPGVVIPRNVTIASNRGSNGSPGGRFFWKSSPSDSASGYQTGTMFYIPNDDVRITGLRLEGPHMTTDTSMGEGKVRSAMDLRNGKGLEVDNCEMYGWSYAAVDIETSTGKDALYALGLNSAEIGSAIANIHHNYIHHCQMGLLGYGVVITRGTALVKANLFDYTRHAIAASGLEYEGYEASYNIHLGNGLVGSVFDMHGQDVAGYEKRIAGRLTKIHHNTLYYTLDYSIGVRGTPIVHEYIYNNKMLWYTSGGKNYPPVYQSCSGTTNVTMKNNMIGGVLYPGEVIRYISSC